MEIISPLTAKSSSYVKNSVHFVERISDVPIRSNSMVSLDVVSLFTKVPTDETLTVVRDKLAADPLLEERTCIPIDNLMEMLTFSVETTYFGMGSNIYRQEGLAMGLLLLPVLANIYIEYFDEMALGSTSLKSSMWLRYVDDTFILRPHQEDVQILLDHVNSIRSSIQFIMEKEQDNKLLGFLMIFKFYLYFMIALNLIMHGLYIYIYIYIYIYMHGLYRLLLTNRILVLGFSLSNHDSITCASIIMHQFFITTFEYTSIFQIINRALKAYVHSQ